MNKIDKLLYGGFGVVALAVIVIMLVSVFSPPTQIVEETVETSKATVEKLIEDAPNQMDRWRQGVANARLQREQSEAWAKLIRAEKDAEQAAQDELDKAEKEWVERFPFEPTYHPEIRYDPYDYGNDQMSRLVQNHGFLRNFYSSYLPYTEEFEQMCNIIEEEFGEVDDPIPLGWTFNTLKRYHQAAQRDPDEIYRENAQVQLPRPDLQNEPSYQVFSLEDIQNGAAEEWEEKMMNALIPDYEVRDVTWGEEAESLKEGILGHLMNPKEIGRYLGIEESVAMAIQERLVNEIPAEGFLKMPKVGFAFSQKYQGELKPGDPLLIN